MEPNINRSTIAWLALLPLAFGCASAGSQAPATRTDPTPVVEHQPKAELVASAVETADLGAVYFETDRSVLGDDARATLRRYAMAIQQHPQWEVVTIEGHCDERGSDEYNFALGSRRASSVAEYLVDLGVAPERLATKTYGEVKPATPGHNETAWRQNRRSELVGFDR